MRATLTTVTVLGLVLAAVLVTGRDRPPVELDDADRQLAAALQPFTACDDLLDHLREQGSEHVTASGLPGSGWFGPVAVDALAAREGGDAAVASAPGAADAGGAAAPGVSDTNVQEAGVDEPDLVETDGRRIVSVIDGRLRVAELAGSGLRPAGELTLPEGGEAQLLLAGDRALVVTARHGGSLTGAEPLADVDVRSDAVAPHGGTAVTTLTLVDLSGSQPVEVARLDLDGRLVSARGVDGLVHLAVSAAPTGLDLTFPEGGGVRGERDALEHNRAVIDESQLDDWLPGFVHTGPGGQVEQGIALDCRRVARPSEFAGFGTLTVLSFPLDGPDLRPDAGTGVLTDAETLTASARRLYLATSDRGAWQQPDDAAVRPRPAGDVTTDIHAFDLTRGTDVAYLGSGTVDGTLLNQFSMSEHDGVLRVATTRGETVEGPSESAVTTLAERDGGLTVLGEVGGLGETERIHAVRFLGERGYVVTFRQVDPLYTIDLSDPSAPRVTGELKIPGYSAYLHPLGDGRLLGVGQDADPDTGRTEGTQVSLFDVADPASPTQLDVTVLHETWSEVEADHHAFTWWPHRGGEGTGTAVVPAEGRLTDLVEDDVARPHTSGMVVVDVAADTLRVRGTIDHGEGDTFGARIRRSLVVDGVLYTLSAQRILGHDLESLTRVDELTW